MKITTGSKIKILENFYAIDFTMFGKPVNKINTCCPTMISEFNKTKGALMSLIIEMYKMIGHSPIVTSNVNKAVLMENAKITAAKARIQSKRLVVTEKASLNIKKSLMKAMRENKELSVNELIQTKIREKAFSLAIDNILIARCLNESTNTKFLNTRQGKFIEDAYKVLRSHLVEQAIEISDVDNILSEKKVAKKRKTI